MTRPIEAVLADALHRLETTGRIDVAAYTAAYPEHQGELEQLLPVMVSLHQERRWQQAEDRLNTFASELFAQLTAQESSVAAPASTLGSLFVRHRAEFGLTLEEQAREIGLAPQALEALSQDPTGVDKLDNLTIKQVAARVAAPFTNLVKGIRRLLALDALQEGGAVFTRSSDVSTPAEEKALYDKVRAKVKRPKPPARES